MPQHTIEFVRIVSAKSDVGYVVLAAREFDPVVHALYVETPPTATTTVPYATAVTLDDASRSDVAPSVTQPRKDARRSKKPAEE